MNADLLRKYFQRVYAHRVFVAVVTAATFLVSAAIELALVKREYDAEVILFRTSPTLGEEGLAALVPPAAHAKAFEELVRSTSVLGGVLEDAIAQRVWGDEKNVPDFEGLRKRLRTSTAIVDETARPINFSPYVTLIATDVDPEVARRLVDIWAERAIEAANRSNELSIDTATETLTRQENFHRQRVDKTLEELAQEKASWNIPLLRTELEEMLKLDGVLREKLLDAQANLAAEQERLRSVHERLALEKQYEYLWRAPSEDVFWMERLESGGASPDDASAFDALEGKGLVHQELNEIYIVLKKDEQETLAAIANAEARSKAIDAQIAALELERNELQSTVEEHDLVQKRLERQALVFETIYKEVAALDSFALAAAELVRPRAKDAVLPVGYNRLLPETYYRNHAGVTTGKTRVALITFLGLAFACAYVIGKDEIPAWFRHPDPDEKSSA